MRKGKLIFGVVAVLMLAGSITYVGCSREKESQGFDISGGTSWRSGTDGTRSDSVLPSDTTGLIGGPVTRREFMASDDAYASRIIDEVASCSAVRGYSENIEAKGYTYTKEHSYLVEGKDVPIGGTDSVAVRVVTLAFKCAEDTTNKAYFLSYAECSLGRFVAPWQVRFSASSPGDDWDNVSGNVWSHSEVAWLLLDPKKAELPMATWCWKCWVRCVVATTAGGCTACAIGCALTAAAYPACAGACCLAQSAGALVKCTLEQLLS
jgi:hypothetical protein